MKKWVGRAFIITLIAIVVGAVGWSQAGSERLTLAGHVYDATVLREPQELTRGLSGSTSLARDRAMLFVFPRDNTWGIWMKDMNYPIDIVWLDSRFTVVHIVSDAQPSSYPKTTFMPPVPSRYVIELASGTIERTGIKNGMIAEMPSGV